MRRFLLILGIFFILPILSACAEPQVKFQKDTLSIETSDGHSYEFHIEVAVTPQQMAQGLMHRTELADDAGMLFLHRSDGIRRMWMKNTLIPLDMLFITHDGRIHKIAAMTTPHSEEVISSEKPVRAVLELRGGLAAEKGIQPGDQVIHPWLAAQK